MKGFGSIKIPSNKRKSSVNENKDDPVYGDTLSKNPDEALNLNDNFEAFEFSKSEIEQLKSDKMELKKKLEIELRDKKGVQKKLEIELRDKKEVQKKLEIELREKEEVQKKLEIELRDKKEVQKKLELEQIKRDKKDVQKDLEIMLLTKDKMELEKNLEMEIVKRELTVEVEMIKRQSKHESEKLKREFRELQQEKNKIEGEKASLELRLEEEGRNQGIIINPPQTSQNNGQNIQNIDQNVQNTDQSVQNTDQNNQNTDQNNQNSDHNVQNTDQNVQNTNNERNEQSKIKVESCYNFGCSLIFIILFFSWKISPLTAKVWVDVKNIPFISKENNDSAVECLVFLLTRTRHINNENLTKISDYFLKLLITIFFSGIFEMIAYELKDLVSKFIN